jgi:hypothetical protein
MWGARMWRCGHVGMWAGGSSLKALSAIMPTVRPWSELPRMLWYPIIRLLASFCSATKLRAGKCSAFKHGEPTTGRLSSLPMPQLSMTAQGFHGAAIIDRCWSLDASAHVTPAGYLYRQSCLYHINHTQYLTVHLMPLDIEILFNNS